MPEEAIHKQMLLADQVGKLAYELYTEAVLGDLADEEKLRETLDGWYDAEIPKNADLSFIRKSQLNSYMQDAILDWMVALAADSQDEWDDTRDILNSLYATGQGETFVYEDGNVVISVDPLGGLSYSGAVATAGYLTCTIDEKEYKCPFYMNPKGANEVTKKLLEVMREFAQNETLKELKAAMEKDFGKDNAKYINAIIDVIAKSQTSDKEITEVIYENYIKKPMNAELKKQVKKFLEKEFEIAKDIAGFKKKWDKYIAPVKESKQYADYFEKACEGSTGDMEKMMEQYKKLLKLQ